MDYQVEFLTEQEMQEIYDSLDQRQKEFVDDCLERGKDPQILFGEIRDLW